MQPSGADALAVLEAGEKLAYPSEDFLDVACEVVRGLIRCDVITFNRVYVDQGRVTFVAQPPHWADRLAHYRPVIERLAHQHPLVTHYLSDGRSMPVRISDVVDQTTWTATELYREYFKPLGLRHQMLLAIPSPDNRMNVLVLSRTCEDFADRDLAMLGALRPHLTLGCRTSATTSLSETEAVAGGWMVVSADSGGTITATSTPDATGTFMPGASLPTELVALPVTEGLTVDTAIEFTAPTTRWVIRVVSSVGPERVLLAQLLTHTSNEVTPLTARQREVLQVLAQGCTNREIADRLGIAEATAKKHLQHIFLTLGVTNRVAAAARVRNGSA